MKKKKRKKNNNNKKNRYLVDLISENLRILHWSAKPLKKKKIIVLTYQVAKKNTTTKTVNLIHIEELSGITLWNQEKIFVTSLLVVSQDKKKVYMENFHHY